MGSHIYGKSYIWEVIYMGSHIYGKSYIAILKRSESLPLKIRMIRLENYNIRIWTIGMPYAYALFIPMCTLSACELFSHHAK